jgi:hypothetical protein
MDIDQLINEYLSLLESINNNNLNNNYNIKHINNKLYGGYDIKHINNKLYGGYDIKHINKLNLQPNNYFISRGSFNADDNIYDYLSYNMNEYHGGVDIPEKIKKFYTNFIQYYYSNKIKGYFKPDDIKIEKIEKPKEIIDAELIVKENKDIEIKNMNTTTNQIIKKSNEDKYKIWEQVKSGAGNLPIAKIIDYLIRTIFIGLRLGTGITGTVASFANGGDTIALLIMLTLQSGILLTRLAHMGLSALTDKWVQRVLQITFENGPNGVKNDMEKILNEIEQEPNSKSIKSNLCAQFTNIFSDLLSIFSTIISAFIPDDSGIAATVIEISILIAFAIGTMGSFWVLQQIYNYLIPSLGKDFLQNPKKLEEFLYWISKHVKNSFKQEKYYKRFTMWALRETGLNIAAATGVGASFVVSLVIPGAFIIIIPAIAVTRLTLSSSNVLVSSGIGQEQVLKLIDIFENRIPQTVELIQKVMPLMYATAYLIAKC